jgi:hypothetical protein
VVVEVVVDVVELMVVADQEKDVMSKMKGP